MYKAAFIIVDMQYDFLPGGALPVKGGDEIIDLIVDEAKNVKRSGGIVIATRDYHPVDHVSFDEYPEYKDRSWPPHCIQGTKGVKIHPKISRVADFIISKGYDTEYEAYSAFAGTTLKPKLSLEELLQHEYIDLVMVAGLALDFCVMYTALDANALGYHTEVELALTRSINPDNTDDVVGQLERAGVETY